MGWCGGVVVRGLGCGGGGWFRIIKSCYYRLIKSLNIGKT